MEDYVKRSIDTLKYFFTSDSLPYYGAYSGGKDSIAIKELVRLAEVPAVWHHHLTTLDAPEVVRFIRQQPDVVIDRPAKNFFRRMEEKGFPTRRMRWCCEEYKERYRPVDAWAQMLLLGIRAEESARRKNNWKQLTALKPRGVFAGFAVNPILEWTQEQVWEFIKGQRLPYPELYDQGWSRIGCVGCPMGRRVSRERDFARWPVFERLWKRSFARLWQSRSGTNQRNGKIWFGDKYFHSAEEMWEWWLNDAPLPEALECQDFMLAPQAVNFWTGDEG